MMPPPMGMPPTMPMPPAPVPTGVAGGGWAEFRAPDGSLFYHNAGTGATQHAKPEELLSEAERALGPAPWTSHLDASSGKTYYHKASTGETTWTKPQELAQYEDKLAQARSAPAAPRTAAGVEVTDAGRKAAAAALAAQAAYATGGAASGSRSGKGGGSGGSAQRKAPTQSGSGAGSKGSTGGDATPTFANDAERREAFHALLEDKGIAPGMKWAEVAAAVSTDPRYRAYSSAGQRKAAYNEWSQAKRKAERDAKRAEATARRNELLALLAVSCQGAELPPGVTDVPDAARVITPATSYAEAQELFAADPRWAAMDGEEAERRHVYGEWARGEGARQAELAASKAAAARQELEGLLEDWLARGRITLDTPWSEVKADLSGEPAWATLGKKGVLEGYKDFILSRERRLRHEREDAARRVHGKERSLRHALLHALRRMAAAGDIPPTATPASLEEQLARSDAFKAYSAFFEAGGLNEEENWALPGKAPGTTPKPPPQDVLPVGHILRRFLEDQERLVEKDRRVIDTTERRCGASVAPDTGFHEWTLRLVEYERGAWRRHHAREAAEWDERVARAKEAAGPAQAESEGADKPSAPVGDAAGDVEGQIPADGGEGAAAPSPAAELQPLPAELAPYPGHGRVEELPDDPEYGSGRAPDGTPIFGPVHRMARYRMATLRAEFEARLQHAKAQAARRQALAEEDKERYKELLRDYYYRSDHVESAWAARHALHHPQPFLAFPLHTHLTPPPPPSCAVPWSEAADEMAHRTAFRRLAPADREALFQEHMSALAAAAAQAAEAAKARAEGSAGSSSDEGEVGSGSEGGEAPVRALKRSKRRDPSRKHRRDDGRRHTSSEARRRRSSHDFEADSRPSPLRPAAMSGKAAAIAAAAAAVKPQGTSAAPAGMPAMPGMGGTRAGAVAAAAAAAADIAARVGGSKRPRQGMPAMPSIVSMAKSAKKARPAEGVPPPSAGGVAAAFGDDDSEEEGEVR